MTILPDIDDDGEFTQLTDLNTPRADMVGAPAHGWPGWLVMKQDAEGALLDPEFVRELLSKGTEEEAPVPASAEAEERLLPNGITLKGSAADIAAFIHAASDRPPAPADVAKAKNDTADREKKAGSGAALPDGSYPIADRADLGKAIHAVGRGGASHDAIRKHIISRARSLGASSEIPDNWNSDGSLKGDVSKEADVPSTVAKADPMDMAGDATVLDEGMDGLDPTVPLAAPDDELDMPGDPTDPGSPAWEAIDAATASKWLSILARAKNALCLLAEREMTEAAVADPSDAENAFDLEDAACAIDYAISQLAVFASSEQAEAEIGAELEEMCKALAAFDPAPLAAVEGLTAIAKAGRVLSAANEAAIRQATESLQKVLSSLPEAPVAKQKEAVVADTDKAADVAKERTAEEQARDTGPVNVGGTTGLGAPRTTGPAESAPADGPQGKLPGDVAGRTVVKAAGLRVLAYDRERRPVSVDPAKIRASIEKADGDTDGKAPMQAVWDEDGNMVGIVDPADIIPVSGGGGKAADPDPGDVAPAAAPADDDMPQPPADAGMAADAVGKGAQDVITAQPADLESIIAKAVATALSAVAPAQDVAKSADVAGAIAEVERLKARIAKVEEMPAAPGVFTNGQRPPEDARPVPPQGQLRGQDQGATQAVNVAKAVERKASLYAADGPEQVRISKEMQEEAIAALAAMHASRQPAA